MDEFYFGSRSSGGEGSINTTAAASRGNNMWGKEDLTTFGGSCADQKERGPEKWEEDRKKRDINTLLAIPPPLPLLPQK